MPPPGKTAILSPGLLGGSIAAKLRQLYPREPDCHIALWGRTTHSLAVARQLQLGDSYHTAIAPALANARWVILCMPVEHITHYLRLCATEHLHQLDPHAIITDVGSVKTPIVTEAEHLWAHLPAPTTISFVGSHPMAGSENAGTTHATAQLFTRAMCLLTPSEKTSTPAAIQQLSDFWAALGCRTHHTTAPAHDRLMARISHLPHIASSALASTTLGTDPADAQFAGGGLRDTTRLAAGSPTIWSPIIRSNASAITAELRKYAAEIRQWADLIERDDAPTLHTHLTSAQKLRHRAAPHFPPPTNTGATPDHPPPCSE